MFNLIEKKEFQSEFSEGKDLGINDIKEKVESNIEIDFEEFGYPDNREKEFLLKIKNTKPNLFNKLKNNIIFNGDEISIYVEGEEINHIFKGRVNKWYNFYKENITEKTKFENKEGFIIPSEGDFVVLSNFIGRNNTIELFNIFNIDGIKSTTTLSDYNYFLNQIHYHSMDLLEDSIYKKTKKAFYLVLK